MTTYSSYEGNQLGIFIKRIAKQRYVSKQIPRVIGTLDYQENGELYYCIPNFCCPGTYVTYVLSPADVDSWVTISVGDDHELHYEEWMLDSKTLKITTKETYPYGL